MTATIRPARLEDVHAMDSLFREAGRAAWPHILPEEVLAKLNPPKRWADAVAEGLGAVLVAEEEGVVVGFAVTRPSQDPDAISGTAEIDSFYTHPDVWGKGFGRKLLQTALDDLKAAGFKRVTLWTAEENHRPRSVYEKAGWEADGASRHRTLHGAEFIELRYRITL